MVYFDEQPGIPSRVIAKFHDLDSVPLMGD